MKNLLAIPLILLLIISLQAQKKSVQNLMWLEGRWNRTDVSGIADAFEEWYAQSGELTGLGAMLEEGDTVFVERLSIRKKLGNLFYVTEVTQNAEPTWFKITSISNNSFICENETHDFPKKIGYFLDNKILTVKISGNSRTMSFIFEKED